MAKTPGCLYRRHPEACPWPCASLSALDHWCVRLLKLQPRQHVRVQEGLAEMWGTIGVMPKVQGPVEVSEVFRAV